MDGFTVKAAGISATIITAKHAAGFCLWFSQYTDCGVKDAVWNHGKDDVVREFIPNRPLESCLISSSLFSAYHQDRESIAGYGEPGLGSKMKERGRKTQERERKQEDNAFISV